MSRANLELNIQSVSRLSKALDIPLNVLLKVAESSGRHYRPFVKTDKQRPFAKYIQPMKRRDIDNPIGELKSLQTRILRRLLRPLKWPDYLLGGIQGRRLADNSARHAGASLLVTLDIRKFFPSIMHRQVFNVWKNVLGCSPEVARILTKCTTYEGRLPQGAPTSNALANLVLFSIDSPLRKHCEDNDISYTTWVDDLAFSGVGACSAIEVAVKVLRKAGFSLPHKKQRVMRSGGRQILNGLIINNGSSVLKAFVSNTRSGIHKYKIGRIKEREGADYLARIRGQIAYIKPINPRRAEHLQNQINNCYRHSPAVMK